MGGGALDARAGGTLFIPLWSLLRMSCPVGGNYDAEKNQYKLHLTDQVSFNFRIFRIFDV